MNIKTCLPIDFNMNMNINIKTCLPIADQTCANLHQILPPAADFIFIQGFQIRCIVAKRTKTNQI